MPALARFLAMVAAICVVPPAASAASFKLYPVRIVLTAEEPVQTMTITNTAQEPARVQLRVLAWSQANGEDVFEETRDVLVNPPIFEIPPGGDQIARFGLRAAPGSIEKSYRVFLQEVPGDRQPEPGQIRTLLRISVPIFVPPPEPVGRLEWELLPSATGELLLAVHNRGNTHVQINHVALSSGRSSVADEDVSVYVLPGASRQLTLERSGSPVAGEALALTAQTDRGDLTANIVSEAAPRGSGDR